MKSETEPAAPKLRRLRGRITRADALAWESLPRELTGVRKLAFFVFLGSAGLWVGFAADVIGFDEAPGWLTVLLVLAAAALHWGLAAVVMTWRAHVRAARRLPWPCDIEIEDDGDHLMIRERDGHGPARTRFVPFELIAEVFATDRHLMLVDPPDLAILPLAAFADVDEMRATAADWQARAHATDGDD